ncbi:MAG: ABC transporter ATP-binding protein [Phycisphaerae bacterium]|jgi:oligopeptide/dipeptide ABC transporter ATP-binding protein
MSANGTLLRVCGLSTVFHTAEGLVRAVDGASFTVPRGRTFALVGESGCGKSVTALSILRLIPTPPGQIVSGRVEMGGKNLLDMDDDQIQAVRGGQISMIFQEPMSSLNPVFTCGSQIVEAIRQHRRVPAARARQQAVEMLAKVGIPDPAQRFREYPHQLSGGMRQRVMIAMALSCGPQLLIADEPTTALDVTIQAQILDLLRGLQDQIGLGILLITHDLAVVAGMADVIGVMYASKMAELAGVEPLFRQPLHPYTQGLFRSLPRLGATKTRLEAIGGNVPNPLAFPAGCKFHPRCPIGHDLPRCRTQEPPLREVRPAHWAACWECPGYAEAPQTDPAGAGGKEAGHA